jgi:hypothetical protein
MGLLQFHFITAPAFTNSIGSIYQAEPVVVPTFHTAALGIAAALVIMDRSRAPAGLEIMEALVIMDGIQLELFYRLLEVVDTHSLMFDAGPG